MRVSSFYQNIRVTLMMVRLLKDDVFNMLLVCTSYSYAVISSNYLASGLRHFRNELYLGQSRRLSAAIYGNVFEVPPLERI